MTQSSDRSDAPPPLAGLAPFLGRAWPDAPAELRPVLQRLDEVTSRLQGSEPRITVFGAFKTGKSSLINALAGAPILPTGAQEGTRAVTRLRHGQTFRAWVEDSAGAEEIAAPDIAKRIVGGATEVVIEAPLPLLDQLWEIEDTPGLFRSVTATERSMSRLERTDLAIVVLAADQILSANERAAAAVIDRRLLGNLIYAVNRIDAVEKDERADVLEWATHSLEGSGNALVGRPCITPISARAGQVEGIDDLRDRLLNLCTTDVGERVVTLSRLGRLQTALLDATQTVTAALGRREDALAQARAGWSDAIEHERREIRRRLSQGRRRLQGVREGLPALADSFVERCVDDTWHALQRAPKGSGQGLVLDRALISYGDHVSDSVLGVVLDLPVTVKPWDPSTWLVRATVHTASHLTTDLGMTLGSLLTQVVDGGETGRAVGQTVGGWLGKNVFGMDVEAETRKRIDHATRAVLPALQAEAETYIGGIDALLADAERYYAEWTHLSPQIVDLERDVDECRGLSAWLDGFMRAVRELIARSGYAAGSGSAME